MPDGTESDDPKEWMLRAFSNLNIAKSQQSGVFLEDLCFNAQQAVEKAIKAVLIKHDIDFPYTHNIAELLTLLQKSGHELTEFLTQSAGLTLYAVSTRYPYVSSSPVEQEEYEQTVMIAEKVVYWADDIINPK
ncbi:MAG: HEPN domain-containing protein [Candidatus Poribacteria bacterium]